MPDNELDLMQWQVGKQTLFATEVVPTAKLIGVTDGEIAPLVETSAVPEQRATLAPAFQATVDKVTGEATVSGDANFEQLPYFLDSLLGEATPGTGPAYKRDYAAPLGSKPSPRIMTLVRGSALDSRALKGAIVNELTIAGENNKRITYEAKAIGHSVIQKAVAVIADTSPNYIHANQVAIALDTWAGTMGGTPLTPTAYSFELGLNFNKMVQHGLGSLTPKDHKIKRGEPDSNQLKLSMELDTTSAGYFNSLITATTDPWRAQIQLTFTSGSLIYLIQYAGYAAEAPSYIADTDGVATLEFVFSPLYHATLANWLKMSVSNLVATLP